MVPSKLNLICLSLIACLAFETDVRAQNFDCKTHPLDCKYTRPIGGDIVETTRSKQVDVTLYATGRDGEDLSVPGFPKHILFGSKDGKPVTSGVQHIPVESGGKVIYDVHQVTKVLKDSGEINDLKIEAVYKDPSTGRFELGNIFGAIADQKGIGQTVWIPDLFADTNTDGILGEGDLLYSVVDLNVFLVNAPSFNLGDTFNFANGPAAELPGMIFSTKPFTFAADTGWTSDGGDFTGAGSAESIHGDTPTVPDPSAWIPVTAGVR